MSNKHGLIIAAEDALLKALNSGATPLAQLELPRFRREFRSNIDTDRTVILSIDRKGFRRYKHRSKTKTKPPPADTIAIQQTLNILLAPRFKIVGINDEGQYIKISMEELHEIS